MWVVGALFASSYKGRLLRGKCVDMNIVQIEYHIKDTRSVFELWGMKWHLKSPSTNSSVFCSRVKVHRCFIFIVCLSVCDARSS